MIKHRPLLDIDKVEQFYSEKDGVPVKYVCSSAIGKHDCFAADIFYRKDPHPDFGNRYFGLYFRQPISEDDTDRSLRIANADNIETLDFEMIEVDGDCHYSKHRHDFYTVGSVSIDGGREYLRLLYDDPKDIHVRKFKIVDGCFVEEDHI